MIIEPYRWYRVNIERITRASVDTVSITLTRPSEYIFHAGQYTIIRLKNGDGQMIMRQYSFSSSPEAYSLECTIQKEPGGEASSWFFEHAHEGDMIEISQAFGKFIWDPHTTRPLLFIAGRVGIAPFMSMIRNHRGHKRAISILYSVNDKEQVCFRGELEDLNTRIFVTQNGVGRITKEAIEPYMSNQPLVYICGSRGFVEAMQKHLFALSVPADDIHRELFTL